jgi:SAM-dependent methyltransferase
MLRGLRLRATLGAVRTREWDDYIDRFHSERAGITETVLGASTRGEINPYQWLADALPEPHGRCLDLACGSAPLKPLLTPVWIGVDLAAGEVALARARRAPGSIVQADVAALPFRTSGLEAAVCAMALMVVAAVEQTLRELARAVREGATVVFLLPGTRPLTMRDRLRYARLLGALRRVRVPYPRPDVVAHPERHLCAAGFTVAADERRTFRYPIIDTRAARALVDSLYLPGTPSSRIEAAHQTVLRWVDSDIGIPLRRVVATRDNDSRGA